MMPWFRLYKDGWRIVGMNHYNLNNGSYLFCAMTKDGRCIVAESQNETDVFTKLEQLAGINMNRG